MTVVVGVVFGLVSVRQAQRMRSLSAAVQLVNAVMTPDFTRAIGHILDLPERAPAHLVLDDQEAVGAAYVVGHFFESLAVLVLYRLLPLELVDHLVGGYARESWHRLAPYMAERRERLGPTFGEWFQWLVERMEERPARGNALGAPEAHKRWKPNAVIGV